MTLSRLDDYFPKDNDHNNEPKSKEAFSPDQQSSRAEKAEMEENPGEDQVPRNLPPSYFISATYDGDANLACIKLYEPVSKRIYR